MPLFRFHKDSLDASLATTIIVKNKEELLAHIYSAMRKWIFMDDDNDDNLQLEIEPYPSKDDNFDARIGWFTHIVIAKYFDTITSPVGFLSEPLED